MPLTQDQVRAVGNAVLAELSQQLSIPKIRQPVGRAGFDTARIPAEDRRTSMVPAIQRLFGEMDYAQKLRAVPILTAELTAEAANMVLRPHGYQFVGGQIVPLALANEKEFQFLPASSAEEIASAFDRLSKGDEDGAISAACSAVDTATLAIYEKYGLGHLLNHR